MAPAAGRWRDEKPEELDRLRDAVREWHAANPEGTVDQMIDALAGQFRDDWEPVFRAAWLRAGLGDAEIAAGVTIITGETGE
jgi:hypothetical protein